MAILNFLARRFPALAGLTDEDFAASQQLLCEAEDLFQKYLKLLHTVRGANEGATDEQRETFWTTEALDVHVQRGAGFHSHMIRLEAFAVQCQGNAGRFTSSGKTVG